MEKYSANKKYTLMAKDQVRAVDSWAINELGIPGVVLMENAGRSCAELIQEKLKDIAKYLFGIKSKLKRYERPTVTPRKMLERFRVAMQRKNKD